MLLQADSSAAHGLPLPQVILALTVAFSVLVVVIELVRRKKLREEYALLWMGTATVLVVFALWTDVLAWLADVTQAESIVSILYFGAFVFLMLVAMQFSVRLTKLSFRSNTMSQKIALLENEIEQLKRQLAEREAAIEPAKETTEAP